MKQIIFITENVAKYSELEAYINSNNVGVLINVVKPEYELNEIQSLDRKEIVLKKIRDAVAMYSRNYIVNGIGNHQNTVWIMVEDTSLCIDKMGGFPGPFIKYYLRSLSLNLISNANWGSHAQSCVSLGICKYSSNDGDMFPIVFEGVINGVIVEPKGQNGFGYDAIFRPDGSMLRNAEMPIYEKEKYNPRIHAFQQVLNFINK